MEKNIKITVVTVCYNAADVIEKTILSVIGQTYDNKEYIVIDGGSTDGTVETIKRYAEHIDIFVSEPDKGIFDAMNKGVARSQNIDGYVNFLNAGDSFYSSRTLELVLKRIDNTADFVCGIAKYPNGRYWSPVSKKRATMTNMLRGGGNHQSTFLKISMMRVSPYDVRYRIIEDDLYLIKGICIEGRSYQPISLIVANYDNTGISNASKYERKKIDERVSFFKEYAPQYLSKLHKTKMQRLCEIVRKAIQMLYIMMIVERKSK